MVSGPHDVLGNGAMDADLRFELLVQAVTDYALFMLDPDGYVVNWNTGAQRAKGYSAAEIIGRHFSCFYTPADQEAGLPARALAIAAATGHFEQEGWRVRKDGTQFWASVVIDPVRGPDGELLGYAKITHDNTERRQAALDLEQTREQLFQAQKLEAIGHLTGGIAHDFNNLLTVIRGSLDLATRRAVADPKMRALLAHISQATDRAASLTEQLLLFARRGVLNARAVDTGAQLRASCAFIERSLGRDIDLVTDFADPLEPIQVDPRELDLALLNLCLNARDAMKGGGVLRISGRNLAAGAGLAVPSVAISVTDDGAGIAAELLPRVIEPFFTTKDVGAGTGLGLSQAFGFAHQSGGQLHIESELDRGTTVTMWLPVSLERPHGNPVGQDGPADEAAFDLARIMLVQDDPAVAELACTFLEESGYRVLCFDRPRASLAELDRGVRVDLLFSDIMMPGGMNGIELARLVRARFPATGYSEAAARDDALDFPVMSKPYSFNDLSARIAQMLEQRLPS